MFSNTLKKVIQSLQQEIVLIIISLVGILVFIPVFTYSYFANDLKTTTSIMNRGNTGVILYDRNGKEFFKFYQAKYAKYVPLSAIPKRVQQAVLVAEDKDFYYHPGFSLKSIIGAFIANIRNHDLAYGGSTITQQLVKNSLLTPHKDFVRKYQELVLAQELERRYTKDQILEMYLNSVYFGDGAFGIEAASETYFGKSVDTLDTAQASMLAGMLNAPSELSPLTGSKKLGIARQHYVLKQLVDEKYITPEQEKASEKEQLVFTSIKNGFPYRAPHFALMVRDQLIKQYGEETIARSGFKVYTTLDLSWQEYAEKVVKEQVAQLAGSNVSNGAAVVIDPHNGEVRVLVGSRDWNDPKNGKVNLATTPRQPGSSFKPIIYSAAMERGLITPATVLQDKPTTFPTNYRPKNYDGKFRGPVLVRRALSNSLNVPAVEVMQRLGVEDGLDAAKAFGITTLKDPSDYGLSLVLGAGEVPLIQMTNVYATFANNGQVNEITTIDHIENKQGKVIYQYKPKPRTAVSAESAFLISSILSDNKARQEEFGNVLTISRPAAVKTGTSEDYRDSLTLGYTPQIAVGVWVGNNDNEAMSKIAGSIGAAPIWRDLMTQFLASQPVLTFKQPPGVIATTICKDSGLLAKGGGATEYFIEGTEPTRSCGYSHPVAQISPPSITISPLPTISVPPAPSSVPTNAPVPTTNPAMQERTAHVEALLHQQMQTQNQDNKEDNK